MKIERFRIIELTDLDIKHLFWSDSLQVIDTKILIFGPNILGIVQNGWELIQLTHTDLQKLCNGLEIIVKNFVLKPKIDYIINTKGILLSGDISTVYSPYMPIDLKKEL